MEPSMRVVRIQNETIISLYGGKPQTIFLGLYMQFTAKRQGTGVLHLSTLLGIGKSNDSTIVLSSK